MHLRRADASLPLCFLRPVEPRVRSLRWTFPGPLRPAGASLRRPLTGCTYSLCLCHPRPNPCNLEPAAPHAPVGCRPDHGQVLYSNAVPHPMQPRAHAGSSWLQALACDVRHALGLWRHALTGPRGRVNTIEGHEVRSRGGLGSRPLVVVQSRAVSWCTAKHIKARGTWPHAPNWIQGL